MALAKLKSAAIDGVSAKTVEVEVDVASGLPGFNVVGLADKAVEESRERVRSAVKHSGFSFPLSRITVHLAPSDYKKTGLHFDLPIALGVLLADGQLKYSPKLRRTLLIGGLSLDGGLQPINGTLVLVEWAKSAGLETVVLPSANLREARLVEGIELIGAETFSHIVDWLLGRFESIEPKELEPISGERLDDDWLQIRGQEQAKRAAIVAASGAHNLLLEGPPGAGKTLLAKGIRALLPSLSDQELIDVVKIHSVAGVLKDRQLEAVHRPFRSPHHTASNVALVGGGANAKPGEISLSHRGILFLDELPEFQRPVLEALRQPLEDGEIHVSRVNQSAYYPARFQLIATMNPCPCGWFGSEKKECICTANQVAQYRKKISGPILDRMDVYLRVPLINIETMQSAPTPSGELSAVRQSVERAQARARARNNGKLNSQLKSSEIGKFIKTTDSAEELLRQAAERFVITGRGYHKLLKVSQTIADLAEAPTVTPAHAAEALQYRFSDA